MANSSLFLAKSIVSLYWALQNCLEDMYVSLVRAVTSTTTNIFRRWQQNLKKLTAVLVDVIMMTDIPTNMLSTPMSRQCVSLSSPQLKANVKSGLKISQQDSKSSHLAVVHVYVQIILLMVSQLLKIHT